MTPKEWLEQPWVGPQPFRFPVLGGAEQPSMAQILAALIGINGGSPLVKEYGIQSFGDGIYGHQGLTQEEALSLVQLYNYACGLCDGQADPLGARQIMRELFVAEWDRVKIAAGFAPAPAPVIDVEGETSAAIALVPRSP